LSGPKPRRKGNSLLASFAFQPWLPSIRWRFAAWFFGGSHEKNDREWDATAKRFGPLDDLIASSAAAPPISGAPFYPFILEGARWIRDNRTQFGLLPSGWARNTSATKASRISGRLLGHRRPVGKPRAWRTHRGG